MNILKARNQLHQISKINPQIDLASVTDSDLHFNENILNQKMRNPKFHKKDKNIIQNHIKNLSKQQYQNYLEQHNKHQQKLQVKIPVFINQKRQNLQHDQKQRFYKLGLEDFLRDTVLKDSKIKNIQLDQQKIIKNLNNTYFRTTDHIKAKSKNMVNTLGIKKSSMSNYKVDWDQKDFGEIQLEWREIGYIPNKVFPCRKNSSVKSKIYTPRKPLQDNKYQRKFTNKTNSKYQNLSNQNNSVNLNQSKIQIKNKLNRSLVLNSSQQFFKKRQIKSGVERRNDIISRPKSQNAKRPWTSKHSYTENQKNLDESRVFSHKRYSEFLLTNGQIVSAYHKNLEKNGQIQKLKEEDRNGYILGKKMEIHM